MSFKIEVEVPAYCAVPYNKKYCKFLRHKVKGRFFGRLISKPRCLVYDKELREATNTFWDKSGILIPCDRCKEFRKIELKECGA